MHYQDNKMTELQIAYIGGGSRGWAWNLMADLAMEGQLGGNIRLYDIDGEAAKSNEIIGNRLSGRNDVPGKWRYTTAPSLEEALTGADFVIISILPGTFDEMESDVHTPEKYGVYQSVGDSVGPGGNIRALRLIPMYVTFAEAIRDYAPDAWVINFTNPMTICVQTLHHIFPGIKAFGCCHEVFGTQNILRDFYQEESGVTGIKRQEILTNVMGINHFTWIDKASYKNVDLIPLYRKYVDKLYEEGYCEPDYHWMNSSFYCANRVKFDLFKKYNCIAAAGDRHLAEFMPGDLYLKNPETVKQWKFGLTTVSWRKNDLTKRLEKAKRLSEGAEEVTLRHSGEDTIALIRALCGLDGRLVTNVNYPNTALQISNLPADATVETNAIFSYDNLQPVQSGSLPEEIRELILPHVRNQKEILQAALSCNRNLVYEVFAREPMIAGRLTQAQYKALADEMIDNTVAFLPKGWK